MPRPSEQWKDIEREIAKFLGGKRIPVHSTNGINCDVVASHLDVEVKHGGQKRVPGSLLEGMAQAVRQCRPGQLAALVMHRQGKNIADSIICFRLSDYADWHVGKEAKE